MRDRKNPWKSALALLMLGVIGFALWRMVFWALDTDYFNIRNISFTGLRYQEEKSARAVVDSVKGTNIFRLKISGLERRLEELPWVKRVRIYRVFPAEITVKVEEKELIAALNRRSRLYGVDRDGHITAVLCPGEVFDLPVISGIARSEAEYYQAVNFLRAASTLCPTVYSQVSEVILHRGVLTALVGKSAIPVAVGNDDYPEKVLKLWALLYKTEWEANKNSSVDLRFPGKIVLSMK